MLKFSGGEELIFSRREAEIAGGDSCFRLAIGGYGRDGAEGAFEMGKRCARDESWIGSA